MHPSPWFRGGLAGALMAVVLTVGTAAAQAGVDPDASARGPSFSCAAVDASPAARNYYWTLCHAFLAALVDTEGDRSSSLSLSAANPDGVSTALLEGRTEIALGLPWEGTGRAPIRHGPVVLILPDGRFGIAVRDGDDELLEAVSWLFHALVEAEARGIDRAAVASDLASVPEATARWFKDYERRLTSQLGLDAEAIRRMLMWAGHHGEIYDRWFDAGADVNRPVELGGQLYAPPVGGP